MNVGTWLENILRETGQAPFSPKREYPIPRRDRAKPSVEGLPQDILSQIKYLSLLFSNLIVKFWEENWRKLFTVNPEACPVCKKMRKKRRKPHLLAYCPDCGTPCHSWKSGKQTLFHCPHCEKRFSPSRSICGKIMCWILEGIQLPVRGERLDKGKKRKGEEEKAKPKKPYRKPTAQPAEKAEVVRVLKMGPKAEKKINEKKRMDEKTREQQHLLRQLKKHIRRGGLRVVGQIRTEDLEETLHIKGGRRDQKCATALKKALIEGKPPTEFANSEPLRMRYENLSEEKVKIFLIKQCLKQLKRMAPTLKRRKNLTLSVDITEETYFGEELLEGKQRNPVHQVYVQGVEKGRRKGYRYIVVSISERGIRGGILLTPVPVGASLEKIVLELLKETEKLLDRLGLRATRILLDRGFLDYSLIQTLAQKYEVICPQVEHEWMEKIADELKGVMGDESTIFILNHPKIPCMRLVLYVTQRNTVGFVTNTPTERCSGVLFAYRLRWAVENLFRDFRKFYCRTSTRYVWARYLLAAIAFVLYTIWAVETLLLIAAQCRRDGKKAVY